jgi:hypothetical protein
LRISVALLDNIADFQLTLLENIAGVLLTLSKNMLGLRLLAGFGEAVPLPISGV